MQPYPNKKEHQDRILKDKFFFSIIEFHLTQKDQFTPSFE